MNPFRTCWSTTAAWILTALFFANPSFGATGAIADRLKCWQAFALSMTTAQVAESGELAEAVGYGRSWLAAAQQCRDTLSLLEAHGALASLYSALGNADSSRSHAAAATELSRTTAGTQAVSTALLAAADAWSAAGRADSARAALQATARAAELSGDSLSLGIARLRMARDAMQAGANTEALALTDSAMHALGSAGGAAIQFGVLAARGECLSRLGQHEAACASFETAYGFLLTRRDAIWSDAGRTFLMDDWRDYFATWEHSWLAQGARLGSRASLSALAVAERGRAQALMDLVQPLSKLVETDSALLRFAPNPRHPFGPGRDLVKDANASIAAAIPPDCALLYYSQLPESLIVWVASRRKVSQCRLQFPARWAERIAPLASGILDPEVSPPGLQGWWSRQVAATGQDSLLRLFKKCCLPDTLLGLLGDATEVVIVTDGWLNQVPFAALPIGPEHIPFGISHALRFAPSLAFLAELERRAESNPEPVGPADVLVMGDPSPTNQRPLPGARAEAESVAVMFGAKALVGPQATMSALRDRWSKARLLHLATHGLAYTEPARGLDSFVILAGFPAPDGRLTAGDIFARLPESRFELVVLSACQTARGALSESEGILGLPRSLMANGARSVLASMWNLPDGSTSWLVQRFYHHLLFDPSKPSKAEALRAAMAETRQLWASPEAWAAFKLYGAR